MAREAGAPGRAALGRAHTATGGGRAAFTLGPSGPPAPPPKQAFLGNVATPPPLAAPPEDSLDVEDEALLEDPHLEPEGDDFAMAFGAAGHAPESQGESDDATAIGAVPAGRPSDHTLDDGGTEVASPSGQLRSNIRNDDW